MRRGCGQKAKVEGRGRGTETRTSTVLAWTLSGFYPPVDMGGTYNVVKGGSTSS